MLGLKSKTFRTGREDGSGGDVRTRAGSVVVGGMMLLVAWCVHGCFGANVLLPEHTQEAPLTAHVEHV